MATAEFSIFAGILNAALSQHHLLGFEIAQLEFHTEELYKKDLHNPDNHDGVITYLESDILEYEVKWALLGSITTNKASGGGGIPVELFQVLKDGLYSLWNSPGQNTGVGSLSLLQGIFPTQESNPGLSHCRWILYQLSQKESPRILEWVAYSFSRGSSQQRICYCC